MRPIDADALSGQMNERLRCCNKGSIVEACLLAELDLVNAMPTITSPPNDPLTLEELREMDGEPVYLAIDHKWYVVNLNYLVPGGNRELCGVDMWGNGTSLSLLAECGLYRRKPEDEKNG